MSDRARLFVLCSAVALASVLALGGARATWATADCPTEAVQVPGLGETRFPETTVVRTGADASPAIPALALLLLIDGLLLFLVGPRVRAGLLAGIAGAGLVLLLLSAPVSADDLTAGGCGTARVGADPGLGRPLTLAGSFAASAVAVLAIPLALRVPRLRLPETGPGQPADQDSKSVK